MQVGGASVAATWCGLPFALVSLTLVAWQVVQSFRFEPSCCVTGCGVTSVAYVSGDVHSWQTPVQPACVVSGSTPGLWQVQQLLPESGTKSVWHDWQPAFVPGCAGGSVVSSVWHFRHAAPPWV